MSDRSGFRATGNRILEGLPRGDRQLVDAGVERVELRAGHVLCGSGQTIRHVYFPRRGVISLFASAEGSPEVGTGVVGTGGMFGLAVAAGRSVSTMSATSQGEGSGDRITARTFLRLLGQSPALRDAMLVYGYELAAQMAQNTACVSMHTAPRRLARWMLDVTRESPEGRFSSTQAATAVALGLQRPAVSRAASTLQQGGLIRYLRGEVLILDRPGLTRAACTCSRRAGPT